MSGTRRWIAWGLLLATPALFAQTTIAGTAAQAAAPTATRRHKSHKTPKPVVLPPLPAGPLSQLPMDQLPPTPAKVSYQDGLLTISAQNSTLGEILRDVRKLTGASIEVPQNANERVVAHLGPGAPRDVLALLLNGSAFDYVMLGSSSDPMAVSSVILMAKPSSPGETQTQTAANLNQHNPGAMPPNRFPPPLPFSQANTVVPQPGNGQPGVAQSVNAEADEADDSKEDEDNADDSADDQAQPQPGQPGMAGANVQDQPQPDPNQPNAGPKTPEQILEMLRRQQPPGVPAMPPPTQPPEQ